MTKAQLERDGDEVLSLTLRESDFDRWSFTMTCGGCPLQFEGEIDGIPYFYRERHERFRIEVFDELVIASGPSCNDQDPFGAMRLVVDEIHKWESDVRGRGLVKDVL